MPDAPEEEADDDVDDSIVGDNDEDGDEGADEEEEEVSDYENNVQRRTTHPDISAIEVESRHAPSTPTLKRRRKPPASAAKISGVDNDKLRSRGVADFSKVGGQEIRLKDLFGPDGEGMKRILATRDYWHNQDTLPSQKKGNLRRSFFESPDARDKEARMLGTWYAETGRNIFAEGQSVRRLDTEQGYFYMDNSGPERLNVLSGAAISPQVHAMKKGSYISVEDLFQKDQARKGWLFNLGARIQEAQWAPNEHGKTQYLAVAVEQRSEIERQYKPLENPKAPAFSATNPYPASIQIWAFDATAEGDLDSSIEPRLEMVICADWGAPRQLRWCPVEATEYKNGVDHGADAHIGLLAGLWSDGRVRIVNVERPNLEEGTRETVYLNYTSAAFEVSIPDTVPTCLHWLSACSLAVATAAGTVAIWTLTRPETFPRSDPDPRGPRPWFYELLADTYILTMSSGWPSRPQYLSISIADGFARLFDLRSPNADTVPSIRGRTLCISQAWHEQTQTFVMPDEHYIVKHTPIRRYYHNLYSMRLESSITRVATSPVHPGVLVGAAEGNVEASNPIGRITNYKTIPWQQKWFTHEWRGPVENLVAKPAEDSDDALPEGTSGDPPTVSPSAADDKVVIESPRSTHSQPLVRILEGYKAIQPGIQHSTTSKKATNPETNKGITIFEEQSAITALAWNPNLKYGTWAVAGMGSGLLRVEDIGL